MYCKNIFFNFKLFFNKLFFFRFFSFNLIFSKLFNFKLNFYRLFLKFFIINLVFIISCSNSKKTSDKVVEIEQVELPCYGGACIEFTEVSDTINSVTGNIIIPNKTLGNEPINWISSDENIINSSTGIVNNDYSFR